MAEKSFPDLDEFLKTDVLKDWMYRADQNMSSHTSTCYASPSHSSTKSSSSDNNACHHQCNYQQQLPSSLSSLESFLYLPQLPVDGDDVGENVWLYPHHHHHLRQQKQHQQQKPSQKRQQRLVSSPLLAIVKPRTKSSSEITSRKNTIDVSSTDHLNQCDDHKKERMDDKPASIIPSLSRGYEHDFYQNCKSTCNHVCGSKPTNSLFPFIATNDTVIAATSSCNSNNDHEPSAVADVVPNNKSQHQRLSSSMSIIIKNNSSDNNSSSHNHLTSPPLYLAANHHQEKHSHQHHTPFSHYRHLVRRRLFIFRICQAFSVLLCVLFLFNLVKNSIWAKEYEQNNRIDPLSLSPSLTSTSPVSSRLQNRLVQSWNMPSIISSSALMSVSSPAFKIPEILSVSSMRSHNGEHDGTDDGSSMLNFMLLDVPNFKFLMNNKTKCNIPRDDDNYFDGDGGDDDDGTSSSNNYGKTPDKNTSTIFFMIIVHSAPRNFEERQAIRETWGSLQRLGHFHIRLVFLLGHEMNPDDDHDGNNSNKNNNNISSNNVVADEKGDKRSRTSSNPNHSTHFSKILRESQVYGDIIVGAFADSYRNLTYKHLMGYIWVLNHCSHAKYILKADDDAFIDLFQLFEFVLRTFGKDPEPALICNVFPDGTKPVRSSDSLGKKWAVTYEEYPHETYPKYCGGLAYLATPNVIREIYRMSRRMKNKFLWIDDVYVTGILRELAHVEPFYLNLRYSYDPEEYRKWLVSSGTNKANNLKDEPLIESSHSNLDKAINTDRKIRVAVTAASGLSNQINNDGRPSPPQKIPFMIVHMERGSQLGREMRELWNKTMSVWSESGGFGVNNKFVHLKTNKDARLKV